MRTQKANILNYMKIHGSITPLEALQNFGCMRLAARIHDLREDGHRIVAETAHGVNRDGARVTYTRYKLGA